MAQHPDNQAANQNEPSNARSEQMEANPVLDSSAEHRQEAPHDVRFFVLTVSDTRNEINDESGNLIQELLAQAGHQLVGSLIVSDDAPAISDAVQRATDGVSDPEAIIVTGGSGIGVRDVTPEALRPLLTKELPGFGEVFHVLSFQEIGSATMLSRAFAGVMGRTLLFVLPGSPNAVRLAMEKLIVPELGHMVRELRPERRTS
ncbi:MAG TPA: molybdenum cofactor biosynthesis protein B [Abditibacteriaceae bacterium]|jgi:molybdenum cofactor biosynthesis protein B|nr:molybdenum cofactor biosynthesis protein B [Abditibacteriaceae bacterium]